MVTGAYHPETSGASLQCKQLVRRLSNAVDFTVLTTTTDDRLPAHAVVDDVDVWRVLVDPASAWSKAAAIFRMGGRLAQLRGRFDLVHLHGFSQKTLLVIAFARAFGKRVLIKLTSVGHDDAATMHVKGGLAFTAYQQADRFVGVGPRFEAAQREAGLPMERFRMIPNGVDLDRFRPGDGAERTALRQKLQLPLDEPVVLFVGFFSHEKRPDLLYEAWADLRARGVGSTLVLIGPTRSAYYEIDAAMAPAICKDAAARGIADRLVFVEQTTTVEEYFRAADVFALPTLREGMPNVVIEAMASGVPPVVTLLTGVTDWIVEAGTGVLVPANDRQALADALKSLIEDPGRREAMGHAARASVARRFAVERTASEMLALYREMLSGRGETPHGLRAH